MRYERAVGTGMMLAGALWAAATAQTVQPVQPAQTVPAVRVASVAPQGQVSEVRQVVMRFDAAAVAAGDPRAPAPAAVQCEGGTPAGSGRWADAQRWLWDFEQPLPAGMRCTLRIADGFVPLGGELQGAREWRFASGPPRVVSVQPYEGAKIEEQQHFLLRFNGTADSAGAVRRAWCEVDGLGERIPVQVVTGPARDALLAARARRLPPQQFLLLACQRPLPAATAVRLVWGPGSGVNDSQRFEWTVRKRFSADFSCERENAQSPCMPLRPMTLHFNAPVPRAQALAVRLQPVGGDAIAPKPLAGAGEGPVDSLQFAAPLPENMRFQLLLPARLQDETGRALANAGSFPLAVATGGMPPLAKFAGAPFGIVEAPMKGREPALLPITLRHVQADLQGASSSGQVRMRRFDAGTPDATLLQWIARVGRFHENELSAREAGLPQAQWTETVSVPDAQGRSRSVQRERRVQTRSVTLLAQDAAATTLALPSGPPRPPRQTGTPATSGTPGTPGTPGAAPSVPATEVLGLPLVGNGYHVVEVESRVLGHALLESRGPMYVRSGALVTPIAVHFKRGRSSSLAWVTTLERARPVAGARVVVNDCRGQPLWSGQTGADGTVRIERGFDEEYGGAASSPCLSSDGFFVTARSAQDLAFVFSRWHKGIEPWRFDIATATGTAPDRRAHTVFDRTLLRAGETVSMKHFVRVETEGGLALPAPDDLPERVLLTHTGSGAETVLALDWGGGARAALSRWVIPKTAALGQYDVTLQRGDQRLASGSFRVEAFRVPLVDARLSAPSGDAIAPTEVAFSAQLNALAGGPMAGAALQLSALLRPASPRFARHPDFSFDAPRAFDEGDDGRDSEDGPASDSPRLVADKLAARTDAQGAARLQVQALPTLPGPADLTAELSFDDPNGEVQTVTQTLRLWPAALVVGLRAPSWAGSRGTARFTALVVDTRGKPLAGREVEVLGRLQQRLSTRTRIVGGFYAYDTKRSTRELGVLCSGRSDAQGRLDCDVQPKAQGEIELLARARDDAGRVAQAATQIWVGGDEDFWFDQDNDDRIDVLPESRQVEPGQTARLQVRMPYRHATALLTVEREGVMSARVLTLTGRNPVIELPIGADWAPNVHVGVLVLRGRVREAPWWSLFTWGWREPSAWWQAFRHGDADARPPTALVDLAKPGFRFGVATLEVGRSAQRLDVTVTADRAPDQAYAVRETVQATVRVLHAGKPLAGAEIAFAAVDEGLLALRENTSWQLLDAMFANRPWGVETATAQGELIGRRHYGRKALPPGGGGGRNPTRELFDTLLLWQGRVVLDAQGQARIAVPLNDSLTRFRLVAVADDGGQRFGSGSTTVRVSQDLQLLPGLAPLAREGDRFDAAFTLRNTTERTMQVTARLAGRSDTAPLPALAPQQLKLAPGAAAELKWPVTVPAGATQLSWTAEAEETEKTEAAEAAEAAKAAAPAAGAARPGRDRVQVVQAVQPLVPARVWQATLLQLDAAAPASLQLASPAGALPGRSQVLAALQPRLSGSLPGVQRWFQAYPYTCLEQQASRAIALRDDAAWQVLGDELPGYLDADGLASWFPPAPDSPARGSDRLTAYLLTTADAAGRGWPDATRQRMLGGLAAFVEGRIQRRFNAPRADLEVRKLAALEALSRHGRADARMLGSVSFSPAAMAGWPTSALLDAWQLLQRLEAAPQRAARLAEVQRLLRARLIEGSSTLAFTTEAQDDWWWLMESADANAARLLLAAVAAPDWQADAPRLLSGLLARQQRGAWRTTTANVWGQLAVEAFGSRFDSVLPQGSSSVVLGAARLNQDWAAAPAGSSAALPLSAANTATAPATLQASHSGTGRPWLSLQTLAAVPLTEPLAAGYRITRSVSAVSRKQPGVWSRGDVLRIRVQVDASADMAWVVVGDPVPAGATLLGSGLGRDSAIATQGERRSGNAALTFEERRADAWRGYWEWLPRGQHVVEYTLRLNTSGSFGLPPTRVEAMYAPEQFGETPNAPLQVQP